MNQSVSATEKSKGSPNWTLILTVLGFLLLVAGIFLPIQMKLAKIELASGVLFTVAGIPITNTITTGWIAMIIVIVLFTLGTRSMQIVPGPLQNLVEAVIDVLLDMAESMVGKAKAREFFALFATIFVFVLFSNWLEILPGFTNDTIYLARGGEHIALFRSSSSDLNFTLALALTAMFMVQFWSIRHTGVGGWAGKFINLKGGVIGFYVGFLELISEIGRVISFTFRLFGNLFAGEVLLSVIPSLIPFVAVLPFLGFEVFVGVIQAFVFAVLTLAFIAMATVSHDGGHAEHAH